jgi:hypothetical protein
MNKKEHQAFIAWLKSTRQESCTVGEAGVLLSHYRDGIESGLY